MSSTNDEPPAQEHVSRATATVTDMVRFWEGMFVGTNDTTGGDGGGGGGGGGGECSEFAHHMLHVFLAHCRMSDDSEATLPMRFRTVYDFEQHQRTCDTCTTNWRITDAVRNKYDQGLRHCIEIGAARRDGNHIVIVE